MSNIVPIRPNRRVSITAHQVAFELVPKAVVEKLFYAAIAVGWAASDGEYTSAGKDAMDHMTGLMNAVDEASQFTVLVEREVDEPVSHIDSLKVPMQPKIDEVKV